VRNTNHYTMASTLTLRLDDKLERALRRESAAAGVSKSDVARAALERYLRLRRFERTREKAVPLAESQGLFTDEDVFRRLMEP
jgi:predicted transcriptional regulator